MPPRLRIFLFAVYVFLSEKQHRLIPALYDLIMFHLFSMFLALAILPPLPEHLNILDALIFTVGTLAAAVVMQQILDRLRRPPVRAHWVEPVTRPHRHT